MEHDPHASRTPEDDQPKKSLIELFEALGCKHVGTLTPAEMDIVRSGGIPPRIYESLNRSKKDEKTTE